MRIAVLKYEDAVPTCVTGPADIWSGMSRMYPVLTGLPMEMPIEVDFVTPSGKATDKYDLVIIPAMRFEKIEAVMAREHKMINWLRDQYAQGAELASICVGAFLLASTGLLTGKKATTNWLFADLFRKHFPYIVLEDDKVIVDQGRLYSCGGAFSFTSFMIYLIEKFCGHEMAITASKILMINVHDQPQSTFSIFRFQHEHADEVITDAQLYIEKNYKQPLTLDDLAGRSNMSVRNFIRRFEQATTNTPFEYLQRVRIEAAKKILETRKDGVEQVATRCGYEDVDYFRKIFKRYVAMTPKAYQEKYGRK
ncbi:MAG TPA: helix-turn-helix domain-containing protein [Puia sp.]|nr:helix-turn-helix domain-containing protein [Puia sp.]